MKLNKSLKKPIAVLLSVLMIFSTLLAGAAFSTSAAISGGCNGIVYFDNSQTQWSDVYILVGHNGYLMSYKMILAAENVYSVELSGWTDAEGFYFANGGGSISGGSSSYNINTPAGSLGITGRTATQKAYNAKQIFRPDSASGTAITGTWESYTPPTQEPFKKGDKIYFDNSVAKWKGVYFYGWEGSDNGTFQLENVKDDIYVYEFKGTYSGQFLFKGDATGWDPQTDNLTKFAFGVNNCIKPQSGNKASYDMYTYTEETEPTSEETEPTSEETEPTSEETEPTSEETEPTSEETEPTSEETEPTSEETEPTSEPEFLGYHIAGDFVDPSWAPVKGPAMIKEDNEYNGKQYDYSFTTDKAVDAGTWNFKVTNGRDWATDPETNLPVDPFAQDWGKNGQNYDFTLSDACNVTVYFNSETKEIAVKAEYLVEFEFSYITAVGNGDEGWLNGVDWGVDDAQNRLTEVEGQPGVYQITFTNVPAYNNHQIKFACNGSYAYNWGAETTDIKTGEVIEFDGTFDGENITLEVPEDNSTVTATIDISGFDFVAKVGTVPIKITITPGQEPTSEDTQPTSEDTQPTSEDTQPTTGAAKTFTVNAKSNIAQAVSRTYSEADDQVTVTYYLTSSKAIANSQFTISYDPTVLAIDETKHKTTNAFGQTKEVNFTPVFDKIGGTASNIFGSGMAAGTGDFNASSGADPYDFLTGGLDNVFLTITFNIVGNYDKDTDILLNVEVLNAEVPGAIPNTVDLIDYVYEGTVESAFDEDCQTLATLSEAAVIPTDTEPTSEDTQPTTDTEPTSEDTQPTTDTEPTSEDTQPTTDTEPTSEDTQPTTDTEPTDTTPTETTPTETTPTETEPTDTTPTETTPTETTPTETTPTETTPTETTPTETTPTETTPTETTPTETTPTETTPTETNAPTNAPTEAPSGNTPAPTQQGATSSVATPDSKAPTTGGANSNTTGNGTVQTSDSPMAFVLLALLVAATGAVIVLRKRELDK